MGKDFLKLKVDQKRQKVLILSVGILITGALAVSAFLDTKFSNGYELKRPPIGVGMEEQEVIAVLEGKEKVTIKIEVNEKVLSETEAEQELVMAAELLEDLVKGENEDLSKINKRIYFPDLVPETAVSVEWTRKPYEYVHSDGTLRENIKIQEPVEQQISAILYCQEYTRDFEAFVVFLPQENTLEQQIKQLAEQSAEETKNQDVLILPTDYMGREIIWKKPMDLTFLYFLILTAASVVFLKIGAKRDAQIQRQKRLEEMESDYAQIVSKFTMLLSAGLSVRNAWIRIVMMQKNKRMEGHPVYEEMNWAFLQMQKGIPETEIYERFGNMVGLVHYKKLMAMFVSDLRRGSTHLLEAMNAEMLQAWDEQKRTARQRGERIGTKLLIPMMGMLGVVFMIILVPAFLSFQL